MSEERIKALKGTRDLLEENYASMRALRDGLGDLLNSHGYRAIDTPALESAEIYLVKSGAEVTSRMYTFLDPGGGKVALRPEFTAGVVRAYLQVGADRTLPLRWQYCGPVFRHGSTEKASFRQMTQLGAELIGSSSPRADAEIISLANRGLQQLSLSSHKLVIGHIGAILRLLQSLDLSDRALSFLVSNIGEAQGPSQALERIKERGRSLGLPVEGDEDQLLSLVTADLSEDEARGVLLGLMRGFDEEAAGSRSRDEIVARFLRKMNQRDDPAQLQKGILLISRLNGIRGEPGESLEALQGLIGDLALPPPAEEAIELLKTTVAALADTGLSDDDYLLDLALARDLAYYTGVVFEIGHPSLGEGSILCGGGRYDGLVKALGGGEDTPALGFAYTLERVLLAVEAEGAGPPGENSSSVDVLVVAAEGSAYRSALMEADRLRGLGRRVEMEVREVPIEESLSYAAERDIPEVAVVNTSGEVVTQPSVRTSDVAAGSS
ncbi:MAG: HisS family protein [Dehalococcoidia bacterium]